MIIVPEIETVIILVPRTGSGTLRRAVLKRYPLAMQVYRHMEADGVPSGYDRWRKVGVVRDPADRLWSLYKFLRDFSGPHDETYIGSMRRSVAVPFNDWVVSNETVFTSPYDSAGLGRFWPQYSVRHPLPENRKSQFHYLRPDLGTEVFPFWDQDALYQLLGLDPEVIEIHNRTARSPRPALNDAAQVHIERFFAWDIARCKSLRQLARIDA